MPELMMSPLDALRLMVQHYPGGRPAVAQRLGISDEHLRKQLAGATNHKMGVVDACIIAELCATTRSPHAHAYATAVASVCGELQVVLRVGDPHDAAHAHPQRHVGDVIRETAEVAEAAIAALADDDVTPVEHRKFGKQVADAIAALQGLQAAMTAAARRSKARAQRTRGAA